MSDPAHRSSDPEDILCIRGLADRAMLVRAIEAAEEARGIWWEHYDNITPAVEALVKAAERDLEEILCSYLSEQYCRDHDREEALGRPVTDIHIYQAVRYRGTIYVGSWRDECPHTVARIRPEDILDLDGEPERN